VVEIQIPREETSEEFLSVWKIQNFESLQGIENGFRFGVSLTSGKKVICAEVLKSKLCANSQP
jgi:hypothetical protein